MLTEAEVRAKLAKHPPPKIGRLSPAQVGEARAKLGHTQEAMAKEMGVNLRTFQRWEAKGVGGPAAKMIETMIERIRP